MRSRTDCRGGELMSSYAHVKAALSGQADFHAAQALNAIIPSSGQFWQANGASAHWQRTLARWRMDMPTILWVAAAFLLGIVLASAWAWVRLRSARMRRLRTDVT